MRILVGLAYGWVLAAGVFLLLGTACFSPSTPDAGNPPATICRDSGCPAGEECDEGGCVPVRPTLYPNIQLASLLLRNYLDDTEIEWRAAHADLLVSRTGLYADRLRAANPDARLFEYMMTRYVNHYADLIEDWAATNGFSMEDFYLHYREDMQLAGYETTVLVPGCPPGFVPGWNPERTPDDPPASATERWQSRVPGYPNGQAEPAYLVDVTYAGYRKFLADHAASTMDGSFWGIVNSTGTLEGIMVDVAVYYPNFNEAQLDKSNEFYGIPMSNTHPYVLGYVTLYAELNQGLEEKLGRCVDVMPNMADAFWLSYGDPVSEGVLGSVDWALTEVWVMFRGNSFPTDGSNRAITYEKDYNTIVANIVRHTRDGGRCILGARDLMLMPQGSDRGRLFTLAVYYLVHNPNTFYMYESHINHNYQAHVSEWQWNPAVTYDVGQPDRVPDGRVDFDGKAGTAEHFEFASGQDPYDPTLTYHVLARKFTKGIVLVKMLPLGSVVDDRSATTHTLDHPYKILRADGTAGDLAVTEISIRNNEGIILVLP